MMDTHSWRYADLNLIFIFCILSFEDNILRAPFPLTNSALTLV